MMQTVHAATRMCAEAIGSQPGTEPPADVKEAPMQLSVAVIQERGCSYDQINDVDMPMDMMLETIPEERPESRHSTDGLSSIEAASSRDFDNRSSANNSFDFSGGQPRTLVATMDPLPLNVSGETMHGIETAFSYSGVIQQAHSSPLEIQETADLSLDYWATSTTTTAGNCIHADDDPESHPVLTPSVILTRKESPARLLDLVESQKVPSEFSDEDLFRIEELAEVLGAARSYEDAFMLRRLVLDQAIDRHGGDKASRLLNLIKNANNGYAYKEVNDLVKRAWHENPTLECSVMGYVQRSYLGSMLRARGETRAAERQCRRASNAILAASKTQTKMLDQNGSIGSSMKVESSYFSASRLSVVANLVSVLEEETASSEAWTRIAGFRLMPSLYVVGSHSLLRQVFEWCVYALAEGDFSQMIAPVSFNLWLLAPSDAELQDVEGAILFLYLRTQMPTIREAGQDLTSSSVKSQSICVVELAQVWGISAADVLSVVASIIMATGHGRQEPALKDTLVRRAFMKARAAHNVTPACDDGFSEPKASCDDFVKAYAAIVRRKGDQFSTDNYFVLVRGAIRGIVEQSFHLELEIAALCDPRRQNRWSQASSHLVSEPRSSGSWKSLRAFKSAGRRASKLWSGSYNSKNDIESSSSSQRLSMGSIKSALTFQSMAPSFQSSTPSSRDVIMEDDFES